jgi:hypothetical protein
MLGDPRIDAVHQAGQLDEPAGGVGRGIFGIVVLSFRLRPLSAGLVQGRGLPAVDHGAIVQKADS